MKVDKICFEIKFKPELDEIEKQLDRIINKIDKINKNKVELKEYKTVNVQVEPNADETIKLLKRNIELNDSRFR